jgi:hypothetical protein
MRLQGPSVFFASLKVVVSSVLIELKRQAASLRRNLPFVM